MVCHALRGGYISAAGSGIDSRELTVEILLEGGQPFCLFNLLKEVPAVLHVRR